MAKHYRMTAFRDFLHACSLMDLESKGCAFTWNNNREGDAFVKDKLDRAVCTMEWRLAYPNAECLALPAIGSDHSSLLLSLFPKNECRRRMFRFEAFWVEDEECGTIVRNAWSSANVPRNNIVDKLNIVSRNLAEWSKNRFSNAHKRISWLRSELQEMINNPRGSNDHIKVQRINQEIESLWQQEELYWGMRSRINWLKWGVKNTKFFHATTIQRRIRNRITMLKNSEGRWMRSEKAIKEMAGAYFNDLFKLGGNKNFQPILD